MKKTMFLAALMGAALSGTAMGATTYSDGVTYSGNIFNIAADSSATFHDRNFTNYYSNDSGDWVNGKAFNGNNNDKKFYLGSDTEGQTTTGGVNFWRYAFGDGNGKYQTLRLNGASQDVYLETQFSPFTLGGIITEAGDHTYTIGRKGGDCAIVIQAENGQQANMSIGADTRLSVGVNASKNSVTVASSGTWNIASGKTLTMAQINASGAVANVGGGVSLGNNVQLNVTGGGTLDIHSATLSIGAGSAMNIGSDTTIAFSGTINVIGAEEDIVPGTETQKTEGNGFGTAQYSHVVYTGEGTLSGDVTWQFNGTTDGVNYDAATHTITGSGNSLTYYVNEGVNISTLAGAKHLVVNSTSGGVNQLGLSNSTYGDMATLTINGGRVITARNNGTGFMKGDVTVNAGGTLAVVESGQDALGWGDGATKSITLIGSEEAKATFEMSYTNSNTLTMATNLNLNGHSQVTGTRAFNTYGGVITAEGTDNVISSGVQLRSAASFVVKEGGELLISGAVTASAENGAAYSMTKTGDGTLTISGNISGTAAHKVTINGDGANTIITSASVSNATLNDVTLNGSSYSMTNVTFGGSTEVTADVTETGTMTVASGSVTQMTGTLTADTLAISGTLDLAQTALTASTITLNSGATIELADHAGQLTTSALTVNGDSAINANLVFAANSVLTFTEGSVTLGCTIDFGTGTTIALGEAYHSDLETNGMTLLFSGVDAVEGQINGLENVVVTGAFADGHLVAVKQADNSYNIYATPEPATATLSLLALAGLMARRRRH